MSKPVEKDELRERLYALLKTDPRADTYVIPYRVMDIFVEFIESESNKQVKQVLSMIDYLDDLDDAVFHTAVHKFIQAKKKELE